MLTLFLDRLVFEQSDVLTVSLVETISVYQNIKVYQNLGSQPFSY